MKWPNHCWLFCQTDIINGSCSLNSASKNTNQNDPSCFTRLTSSLEDDSTRWQKRPTAKSEGLSPPRDSLEVWATPHRRGWEWSQCGPERDHRKVRCKRRRSPPVSCCPSGSIRCPGSVCRYLIRSRVTFILILMILELLLFFLPLCPQVFNTLKLSAYEWIEESVSVWEI